jgi:predicted glycosyltransferase involved in capsule biosynthesis
MNYLMLIPSFGHWLVSMFRSKKKGAGIALLVPFRADGPTRQEDWDWLERYWKAKLPAATLSIADSKSYPFSKSASVNKAVNPCRLCDIYVILDADCYIDYKIILDCAKKIRMARREGKKLWFIPYRHFFRLTKNATHTLLMSNPANPYIFPSPPPTHDVEGVEGSTFGHWYGALIQIMPREAFAAAGGMDVRFSGWGGEDVSFMHAVDTLYAKHKTTDNQVLHLWHEKIGVVWSERKWEGQEEAGNNNPLSYKYSDRLGDRERMRKLTEGK